MTRRRVTSGPELDPPDPPVHSPAAAQRRLATARHAALTHLAAAEAAIHELTDLALTARRRPPDAADPAPRQAPGESQ